MKNYLCINGKKTELTDKQLKQLGISVEPIATLSKDGKIAKIGDYEFIVLKKNEDTVELLLKDILEKRTFDSNTNNFAKSEIREELNKFADKLIELVGKDNVVEHTVDLTTLDGLKGYGSCDCLVSLLTFDKARENIELLDEFKLDCWWWLATALSTPKHDIKYSVVCVSPVGIVYYFSCINDYDGVRPFCILKSNIFVSK
jgi:hypothetical protein